MTNEQFHEAMARYFELSGRPNTEDGIAQRVADASQEAEHGELPGNFVGMFGRANELRARHNAHGTAMQEAERGSPSSDPHSTTLAENRERTQESQGGTSGIRADIIVLINVAQQALDSLIVERMELVRLRRSTRDVDATIGAARKQLGELHQSALHDSHLLAPELSTET